MANSNIKNIPDMDNNSANKLSSDGKNNIKEFIASAEMVIRIKYDRGVPFFCAYIQIN